MFRTSCIFGLILFAAWTAAAATDEFVPVTRESTDGTISLYWLKLDSLGKAVVGPALVRQPEQQVYSAEVSPSGEKIFWTEYVGPYGWHYLYSARMNTSSGAVAKGPYFDIGPRYFLKGLSIASKVNKLFYGEDILEEGNYQILRSRIKMSGRVASQETQVTSGPGTKSMPAVSADGRKLYYVVAPAELYLQKLTSSGDPSGAPISVLSLTGTNITMPRVDSKARILTYYDTAWGKVYKMRLMKSGLPVEAPTEMMLTPFHAFGGITSSGRLVVFTQIEADEFTLKASPIDVNGNVTGTAQVLIQTTSDHTYPWMHLF